MLKRIILSIIVLGIAGCNSGKYQSYNSGVGYVTKPLTNDTYHVTYTGTNSTKIEKVNDFALLRSAELTLEKGYKYFVITEATNNAISVKNSRSASAANLTGTHSGPPKQPGSDQSMYSLKAKSELTIELHNEKPEGISYDAYMVERGLKTEYEIVNSPNEV